MMRLLAQRLPFFIDPANLRAHCQPIFQEDLFQYLLRELDRESTESRIFEIGGGDQSTYAGLLLKLASHSGIKRQVVPFVEVDLRILAEAFSLICPEYARVGRHLMESLTYPTIQQDQESAAQVFPDIHPRGIDEALDQIGKFQADPKELLSREHFLKILRELQGRFGSRVFSMPRNLKRIFELLG